MADVSVTFSEEEAGYLHDLLCCHVAGPLTMAGAPLATALKKLEEAGASTQYQAYNSNWCSWPSQKMDHSTLYPSEQAARDAIGELF